MGMLSAAQSMRINTEETKKETNKQREGPEFPSPLTLDHAPAIDKLY